MTFIVNVFTFDNKICMITQLFALLRHLVFSKIIVACICIYEFLT